MKNSHQYWINKLKLKMHPEGGFYKETYCSANRIERTALAGNFSGNRPYSTSIYYMLSGNDFSALHRIKQDELWYHHWGCSLIVHEIEASGKYTKHLLGSDLDMAEAPQVVIKAHSWFGTETSDKNSFAVVGCNVAPGFDFDDFELAKRDVMAKMFPQHSKLITKMTRV